MTSSRCYLNLYFSKLSPFERIWLDVPKRQHLITDICRLLIIIDSIPFQKRLHAKMGAHFGTWSRTGGMRRIWDNANKCPSVHFIKKTNITFCFIGVLLLKHCMLSIQYYPLFVGSAMNPQGHYIPFIGNISKYHLFRKWLDPSWNPFGSSVPSDPVYFLSGLSLPNTGKPAVKLINHVLTAARCLIVLKWKQQVPPSRINLYKHIH